MAALKDKLKKFLLVFFILLTLSFGIAPSVKAQSTTWYNQSFPEWFVKVYGSPENEIFGERYTAAQVQWIIYSIVSQPFLIAQHFTECIFSGEISSCLIPTSSAAQSNIAQKPTNKNLLQVFLEDRPLSGITYTKNVFRKFHIIPVASAQEGFGFQRLDPILPLWRATRNFAYALFVLITIVFAFMIMFRVKISPQVVITVQSALPKIAIALVLVTFSYAIAGFLVDLMYVFIGLISLFFSPNDAAGMFEILTKGLPFPILNNNLYTGIFGLLGVYMGAAVIVLSVVLFAQVGLWGMIAAGGAAVLGIVLATGASAGGLLIVAALILAIVFLLLILIVVWHFIKTVWMFIKAFANVLLLTLIAPLQITLGAVIPSMGFGSWVKSLLGNLAVFPVAGALMMLAFRFLGLALYTLLKDITGGSLWQALLSSQIGTVLAQASLGTSSPSWPPLLGGDALLPLIFIGVSIVIFSMIPKTAELIKSLIEGKPLAFGTAIGEAFYPLPMRKVAESTPVRAFKEATGRETAGRITGTLSDLGGIISPKISKQFGDLKDTITRGR